MPRTDRLIGGHETDHRLRPVYHCLEERIRGHVILCRLALLLIRITETTTGTTWSQTRRELDRLHIGTLTGPAGLFRKTNAITNPNATCSPPSTSPPQADHRAKPHNPLTSTPLNA
jgi:hypothetical protein